MPYRVRRIDWGLLANTAAEGLRQEARNIERVGRAGRNALSTLHADRVRRRQEKESRRRADIDDARQDRALRIRSRNTREALDLRHQELSLRREKFESERRDKQARDTEILDNLGVATESVNREFVETGEVSPESSKNLKTYVDLAGGPEVATRKYLSLRSGKH